MRVDLIDTPQGVGSNEAVRWIARKGEAMERKYHLIAVNAKTGRKSRVSSEPCTHDEACTMLAKYDRSRDVRLEEVSADYVAGWECGKRELAGMTPETAERYLRGVRPLDPSDPHYDFDRGHNEAIADRWDLDPTYPQIVESRPDTRPEGRA